MSQAFVLASPLTTKPASLPGPQYPWLLSGGKNACFSGGLEDERQVLKAVLSGIQQVLALYPSAV